MPKSQRVAFLKILYPPGACAARPRRRTGTCQWRVGYLQTCTVTAPYWPRPAGRSLARWRTGPMRAPTCFGLLIGSSTTSSIRGGDFQNNLAEPLCNENKITSLRGERCHLLGSRRSGRGHFSDLEAYLGTTPSGDTYRPDLIIYGYHSSGPVLLDFTFRNPFCPQRVWPVARAGAVMRYIRSPLDSLGISERSWVYTPVQKSCIGASDPMAFRRP